MAVPVMAAAAITAAAGAQEKLPTPDAVIAGYRQNLAQFPAPHITIRRTLRSTDEMRLWWEQRARRLQQALTDPARSARQREAAQVSLAETRAALDGLGEELSRHEDFWTDRQSWQLRVPLRTAAGQGGPKHAFPMEPLSTTSLSKAFSTYRAYTYAAGARPAMNVWYGIPNPGAPPYARSSDQLLEELPSDFQLPPLGAVAGETAFLAHPVDTILFRPGGQLRVIGFEDLAGRRALKVEHAWLVPSREAPRGGAELLSGDIISAWLDPTQGYLPLAAHWRRVWQLDGRLLNPQHHYVYQTLRTTRIERIEGGGFYPLEGIVELRSVEPGVAAMPQVDQLLAGHSFEPPMLSAGQWMWRAEKVEPRAGSADIYRVKAPAETEWFDETKLSARRPIEPLAAGQPAPPLNVTRWSDNKQHSLAELRGRVVVLYFWIAWQEPCMAPLAALDELQKKYAARGMTVLAVHVGNVDIDEVRRAIATRQVALPSALDAGTDQTPGSTLARYHVRLYPTTTLIDPQGKIAWSSDDEGVRALTIATAKALGVTFPLPAEMSEEEQSRVWNRIYAAMLERQIVKLLPR